MYLVEIIGASLGKSLEIYGRIRTIKKSWEESSSYGQFDGRPSIRTFNTTFPMKNALPVYLMPILPVTALQIPETFL